MTVKTFPRGGKKPISNVKNNLFSKQTKIKIKKRKPKRKTVAEGLLQDEPIILNSAHNLRYSSLYEGMIIFGRIFRVTDYYAIVSLPGQISGKLQATDISESYTKLLNSIANNEKLSEEFKPMSNIYHEGDYIVCYIKELHSESKKLLLSLEPHLINQNLNPSTLKKNSKVVLTVSSIGDHGYVLESGLKNFRAFLSVDDVGNKEIQFYTGKQIICDIKDMKMAENIFTAKVSLCVKHSDTSEINTLSLDSLIPGTHFSLRINKVLNDGLQVYFGERNIGYINQLYIHSTLSSFEKGQEIVGTLLYVMPTIKFAYFSLLSYEQEKRVLSIGDIIPKAKVLSHDSKGILMQLKKGVRGYVPLKRTEVDFAKVASTFTTDSIHMCKIIAYDLIAKLYICTMEKKLMVKQDANKVNLQPGNIVQIVINNIDEQNGYINVSVGKTIGVVPPDQVSDPGCTSKPKVGQNVTARVLESSEKKPLFTLKKSLVESKLPILCKLDDVKVGSIHDGSVVKITNQGVLVRFFGNVKGWIPKHFLNSQAELQKWNLILGQTIETIIKSVNIAENRITLAPSSSHKVQNVNYKVGDLVEGVIIDSSTAGIYLQLNKDNIEVKKAFLPAGHMSPCHEVGKLLAAKAVVGDTLSAIVFSAAPSIILSTTFAPETPCKIKDLNLGDSLLCSVKEIRKESVKVLLPIEKCYKYGTVLVNDSENLEYMYKNQILFGKITKIDKKSQQINLTTVFKKVWKDVAENGDKMMTAVDLLSSYLNKISELSKNIYYTSKPIAKISIGQQINGTVESIMDQGLILKLEGDTKGIVRINSFSKNYKQGDEVEGTVLWINYPHEYAEVTLLYNVINKISLKQNKLEKLPIGVQLRGEIVLVTDWFVLVVLKGQGKGTLVTLPARRHLNDVAPDISAYNIGNKVRCYCVLNRNDANILLPICMLKSAFEIRKIETIKAPDSLPKFKRKMDTADKCEEISGIKKLKKNHKNIITKEKNEELPSVIKNNEKVIINEKKINTKKSNKEKEIFSNTKLDVNTRGKDENDEEETLNSVHKNNLTISECAFKWNSSKNMRLVEESSSENKEVEETVKTKKKNLTPVERRELERQKEREIREQEETLARCQIPQTVDQFDRLVLSNPNSSLFWMQYITYHLQATEIDKARAVARRALKTINFREEDDRLNICKAWLNLESRFGSPESLNEVFHEAVKTNDAQKVYLHMLTVYADAGRQSELEKVVNTMIAKFKNNSEIWTNCGSALLKIGMKDKSRHIMQRALQSLPSNKHYDLMVKFAQLENKFGDKERSQTIFEQLLLLYPKKAKALSSYMNLLMKSDDTDIVR